jgi:hypothetical protein
MRTTDANEEILDNMFASCCEILSVWHDAYSTPEATSRFSVKFGVAGGEGGATLSLFDGYNFGRDQSNIRPKLFQN